jgi:HK97 family phage prohead protease
MTTMQTHRKALAADIVPTAKGFSAIITAETLDRDGEVLIPAGMNAKEFEQNPTLFWNHDYALPVGRCTGLKRGDLDIRGEFVFAQKPDGYAGEFFPEVAAALVGQGVCNAVSVGYVPEDGGMRRASDVDRKKYGDAVHTIYSRWKLLEVSLAPLQANPAALITAVKKGVMSPTACKRWFGVEAPRRIVVSVPIPAPSRAKSAPPIKIDEAIARGIARARGRLYL